MAIGGYGAKFETVFRSSIKALSFSGYCIPDDSAIPVSSVNQSIVSSGLNGAKIFQSELGR